MKRILLIIGLIVLMMPAPAQPVQFRINDGLNNPVLQAKIESNLSLLLTETDAAFRDGRSLDLSNVTITDDAASDLRRRWRNLPFLCGEPLVVERVLKTYDGGWQVRNIPVTSRDEAGADSYQELVVDMDAAGTITLVSKAIEANLYRKVLSEGVDEKDTLRLQKILEYVEQFRRAYDEKNISFMNEIFSDDALIITGKVVRRGGKDHIRMKDDVEYRKQNKIEYLENLDRVFKQAKYIRVKFSDVRVTREPTKDGFFGVTVRQGYTSDIYSDEGYVFMLWDFRNEGHPQIHVRTWSPYWIDKGRNKVLEQNQIPTINDFKL